MLFKLFFNMFTQGMPYISRFLSLKLSIIFNLLSLVFRRISKRDDVVQVWSLIRILTLSYLVAILIIWKTNGNIIQRIIWLLRNIWWALRVMLMSSPINIGMIPDLFIWQVVLIHNLFINSGRIYAIILNKSTLITWYSLILKADI